MKYLLNKINKKKFTVGVIGMGYVGLPIVSNFLRKKINVIGFDIDKEKINKINKGKSYINHVNFKFLKNSLKKNFYVTDNFEDISLVDVIILCVPTPLNKRKIPDLSHIKNTMHSMRNYLRENQILSLESTTYPGTTREIILPILKKKFKVGKNFFLVYSPEREDPGRKNIKLRDIPKVLGGYSLNCKKIGNRLYSEIFSKVINVKNLEVAEFTKILENVFRAVNISLVNELKLYSNHIGVNINDVIQASSTKPFGYMPFYPGPGIGGHCIPIDPIYLSWKANQLGFKTNLIKTSFKINSQTTKNISILIRKYSKTKKINRILILGIAYKKNIDDIRESPALKIIKDLKKFNFEVNYHDPFIKKIPNNRNYNINLKSKKINPKVIGKYDAVVLCTDHDKFNYKLIYKNARLIFDSRNRFPYKSKKVISI